MRQRNACRGFAGYYLVLIMVVLCGFASFGVDFGRVQLVKTELRRAADAAARAGAGSIRDGLDEANLQAQRLAFLNKADGQPVELLPADIEFGKWDTKKKQFTRLPSNQFSSANACRVVARKSAQRGTAVPLAFGRIVGHGLQDVSAEAIVMVIPEVKVNETIQATANPFLAGMPPGTVASSPNPHFNPDVAGNANKPKASPLSVSGMQLMEGAVLTFDSIAGTARHDPELPYFQPDGELNNIGHNNLTTNTSNSYSAQFYNEHGIADMVAPINSLVGVFLSDDRPDRNPAPRNLNFRTPASREFSRLEPELQQLFWIGDGKTRDGVAQEFIVPEGATRLYLATWDFYEWNNNAGWREVKITRPQRLITVK
jgi:hypothetical protein